MLTTPGLIQGVHATTGNNNLPESTQTDDQVVQVRNPRPVLPVSHGHFSLWHHVFQTENIKKSHISPIS